MARVLAAIHGIPVFVVIVCFIAMTGWVADQTVRDVQKILRARRSRR